MRPRLLALSLGLLVASCRCSSDDPSSGASSSAPAASASSPPAAAGNLLALERVKLASGLETEVATGGCGESVAIAVHLAVGSDHDPSKRSGLVRLAGRLLASAPAGGAERLVEVGDDHTLYSVVAPAGGWEAEIDRVAAWMTEPAFTEADFGREKARMLEELGKLDGDDARGTAVSLAQESAAPARGDGKRTVKGQRKGEAHSLVPGRAQFP